MRPKLNQLTHGQNANYLWQQSCDHKGNQPGIKLPTGLTEINRVWVLNAVAVSVVLLVTDSIQKPPYNYTATPSVLHSTNIYGEPTTMCWVLLHAGDAVVKIEKNLSTLWSLRFCARKKGMTSHQNN
jgi:hypothetical protein